MNYFDLAKSLAHTVKGKYRVSAIIFDKSGRILSTGVNSYVKTHPLQAEYAFRCNTEQRIYLHAEIDALVKCKKQGHKIFIMRIDIKGEPVLSKPCPICEMAIQEHGIKVVEYIN